MRVCACVRVRACVRVPVCLSAGLCLCLCASVCTVQSSSTVLTGFFTYFGCVQLRRMRLTTTSRRMLLHGEIFTTLLQNTVKFSCKPIFGSCLGRSTLWAGSHLSCALLDKLILRYFIGTCYVEMCTKVFPLFVCCLVDFGKSQFLCGLVS